ncbi:hypothetical protein BS50DRAFT_664404 [Corynespora cassiicola Philippines]|uniref:Uncharacterized protein n=1 Tax=Corynespora cassiicola Philippines TaxID=1448308 RepID=A0A2T2NVH0_CORCC|nr:hypothetical protein BS50DRAFT_664404 [Corynespora cassiicola Philippines]
MVSQELSSTDILHGSYHPGSLTQIDIQSNEAILREFQESKQRRLLSDHMTAPKFLESMNAMTIPISHSPAKNTDFNLLTKKDIENSVHMTLEELDQMEKAIEDSKDAEDYADLVNWEGDWNELSDLSRGIQISSGGETRGNNKGSNDGSAVGR